MKRGLKGDNRRGNRHALNSYNLFPDEKGTESNKSTHSEDIPGLVTTYSPMKRGLKVDSMSLSRGGNSRYNLFPDEKGTESLVLRFGCAVICELQPIPR